MSIFFSFCYYHGLTNPTLWIFNLYLISKDTNINVEEIWRYLKLASFFFKVSKSIIHEIQFSVEEKIWLDHG